MYMYRTDWIAYFTCIAMHYNPFVGIKNQSRYENQFQFIDYSFIVGWQK